MPIYWLNERRDLERERDQESIPASFGDSTHCIGTDIIYVAFAG